MSSTIRKNLYRMSGAGAAARPKTVAVLREAWVEDRLQHLQQCLLNETVENGRDAKLSHPTISTPSHPDGETTPVAQDR
jgi:hypothetical protein